MDILGGASVAKTAVDLLKTENVMNKATGLMGKLLPYIGLEKKAVDLYIEEIEKSNMSPEVKAFYILNTKKTFKQLKNQKNIADIAISNSKEKTDFSEDSSINEEWLDRFMDSARFVSSEEMQLIWGKILANEFEKPGSTPPNMTRILSEITPNIAKAFRLICSMVVWIIPLRDDGNCEEPFKKIIVPYSDNQDTFRGFGLSFDMLNELETLGLLKFDAIAGYKMQGIPYKKMLLCSGNKNIDVIEEHKEGEIPSGNVLLTSAGMALLSIIEEVNIDGYHDMTKKYLKNRKVTFADTHGYEFHVEGDELSVSLK